ncbi:MAG: hypothetical protein AAF564_22330 [Bacteroidota bacterium]
MLTRQNILYRIRQRVPEFGGMLLTGVGIVLLLSSLFYTPLVFYVEKHLTQEAQRLSASPSFWTDGYMVGFAMFILGSGALLAGYLVIRRHIGQQPNLFLWVIVIEVLAESSIIGWVLLTSGMAVPLPTSRLGVVSALWLEGFVGILGAIICPVMVLGLCFHLKRSLRRSGASGRRVQAHQ